MSVSRGAFLKTLGKSLPGMVLGGGIATAAQRLLNKMAAASGTTDFPGPVMTARQGIAKGSKIDFIRSGPPEGKQIALTFDDGPTPGVTELILHEFQRRKLQATFFMIGQNIAAAPDLARRVLAEGHEIGNHTFTHPNLTTLADSQAEEEIQKTQDIMETVLQYRAAWFRPPLGALRRDQVGMLASRGLGIALWNVDPRDWSQPGAERISQTILADAEPGSIVLCHDLHRQTAEGIGSTLDELLERGFSFVTLSTLLR